MDTPVASETIQKHMNSKLFKKFLDAKHPRMSLSFVKSPM